MYLYTAVHCTLYCISTSLQILAAFTAVQQENGGSEYMSRVLSSQLLTLPWLYAQRYWVQLVLV